jgi:hypothetical protein
LYALQNGWTESTWRLHDNLQRVGKEKAPEAGNLIWEANKFRSQEGKWTDGNWSAFWQGFGIGACPSILQTLSFLPYHSICSGFPVDAYLAPYGHIVRQKCCEWWNTGGSELCQVDAALTNHVGRGLVPFLWCDKSFLVVRGEAPGEHGSRSWIYHPARPVLKTWDRDRFYQISKIGHHGNFHSKFPILTSVFRLLNGEDLNRVRRDVENQGRLIIMDPFVTIEAALWFTLFTLEGRIQAVWEEVENETDSHDDAKSQAETMTTIRPFLRLNQPILDPWLSCFLAVWLAISHHVDPFSPKHIVQGEFDSVLKGWEGVDELCIPKPHDDDAWRLLDTPTVPPKTKAEFCEWVRVGHRWKLLRCLLPWLQLRSILMYYYLGCNGDSSALLFTEANELRVHVA